MSSSVKNSSPETANKKHRHSKAVYKPRVGGASLAFNDDLGRAAALVFQMGEGDQRGDVIRQLAVANTVDGLSELTAVTQLKTEGVYLGKQAYGDVPC